MEYFITCANPFYESVLFRFINQGLLWSNLDRPRLLDQEPLEIEVILVHWNRWYL